MGTYISSEQMAKDFENMKIDKEIILLLFVIFGLIILFMFNSYDISNSRVEKYDEILYWSK